MKKTVAKTILIELLQKLAPRIGARVVLEPEWKTVGQIIFKNGQKRYFRYAALDLNSLAASEVAKDKNYANFFMQRMGYTTIPGQTFFSKDWAEAIGSKNNIDAAYEYAKASGWPVIVKPNSRSQGLGVALVYNQREFYRALRFIFKHDKVALVEKQVRGQDYRVVVLDNKVISAYERIPLYVVGDGQHTILYLLKKKQRLFVAVGRDTQLKLDDPRIKQKLKRQGLTLASEPANGARIFLLDNANLSTGGDAIDVTNIIHSEFKKLAVRLTKDMGLRFCGVDLMVAGEISEAPKKYWILEINSAPGLDHYARSGKKQIQIVENLYLQVLKSME